ncbi:DUF2267 domain-containing protein [Phormidium sp. LEGE 05292]|uniref:DUF2267 domain-containing protein n=1 Tax=[Phormidium] sp. LEGE 05292 TaxID=767427 RepID=UPI0018802D78|nr:DUF2267 domain-containing protein [Phormidium sp. LEGE 05292]MBE9228011.1 DUF2267 domain-containing protein [Phormidium sp. LEGE 05292]
MTIGIREDVVYIMLKKISETDSNNEKHTVNFNQKDFVGRELTPAEFLGHLDYLNQKQYINAEFSGNAYGNQEDVPDAINPKEVDVRIANTYGAPDGPLPHLITFKKAELTQKGRKALEEMESNPPESLKRGPAVPIADKDMPFLQKVMLKAGLSEPYDARDLTEVVYRVMRDLMTTDAADRVAAELHEEAMPTEDKALQMEISDLWRDTNPIVGFLSRVRPPWQGPGIFKINDDRFLFRVANEGGMPQNVDREQVVKAVFSATKDELSKERIEEIADWLPGRVRQLWEEA